MEKKELIAFLREARKSYIQEGLEIVGLFGSYARSEASEASDVDILYHLDTEQFLKQHGGFRAYARIAEIKTEISKSLQKKVDLADIDALSEVGKKYILKDMIRI